MTSDNYGEGCAYPEIKESVLRAKCQIEQAELIRIAIVNHFQAYLFPLSFW